MASAVSICYNGDHVIVTSSGTASTQTIVVPHSWYYSSTLVFDPSSHSVVWDGPDKAQLAREKNWSFLASLRPRDVRVAEPPRKAPPPPFFPMVHRMRCFSRADPRPPRISS